MIDAQGVAEAVDQLTYLGATVCKEEGAGMKHPKNRLSKARSAFVRLKRIWRSKTTLRRAKLRKKQKKEEKPKENCQRAIPDGLCGAGGFRPP